MSSVFHGKNTWTLHVRTGPRVGRVTGPTNSSNGSTYVGRTASGAPDHPARCRHLDKPSVGFGLRLGAANAGNIKPLSKLCGAHQPTDLTSATNDARNCRRVVFRLSSRALKCTRAAQPQKRLRSRRARTDPQNGLLSMRSEKSLDLRETVFSDESIFVSHRPFVPIHVRRFVALTTKLILN